MHAQLSGRFAGPEVNLKLWVLGSVCVWGGDWESASEDYGMCWTSLLIANENQGPELQCLLRVKEALS